MVGIDVGICFTDPKQFLKQHHRHGQKSTEICPKQSTKGLKS